MEHSLNHWIPNGVARYPRVPFTILKGAARKDFSNILYH